MSEQTTVHRAGRLLRVRDARNKKQYLKLATGTQGLTIWMYGDGIVLKEPEVSVLMFELYQWLGKEEAQKAIEAFTEPEEDDVA